MGIFVVLGMVLVILIIIVAVSIFHAFVISTLWAWAIVPVFGLPLLTKAQAYLIGLLVAYLTNILKPNITEDKDKKTQAILNLIVQIARPVLTLFIAWIVVKFFM